MNLEKLGWNSHFQQHFDGFKETTYIAGRVALEHKHMYRVLTEQGEWLSEVSGKMRFLANGRGDFPAIGDWVVLQQNSQDQRATIQAILPRISKFARKAAGTATEEQIVAANVNTIFLVSALNEDFNLRRIERYLTLAWESGAQPVVVLSKADLCAEVEEKVRAVESIAFGVSVHVTSSLQDTGIDELLAYVRDGQTVALLGSSGAGKSTLVNRLYGQDIQEIGEIREKDGRGKHTTTSRELVLLPSGGLLIDTPGMRELQLWDSEAGLTSSFQDIEFIASGCRYRDCQHQTEPGCAVKIAMESGELDDRRYRNYVKLQRELAFLAEKERKLLQAQTKEKRKRTK